MSRFVVKIRQLASSAAHVALRRPAVAAELLVAAALFFAEIVEARPGGGNTYRGGSSSSSSRSSGSSGYSSGYSSSSHSSGSGSSGSGGGGADVFLLLYYLVRFAFQVPAVGVPLLVIVVFFVIRRRSEGSSQNGWTTGTGTPSAPLPTPREQLEGLVRVDPDFSFVLFEDFLYALYSEVQARRAGGRIAELAPYVKEDVRAAIAQYPVDGVVGVVVGSMTLTSVAGVPSAVSNDAVAVPVTVQVEFEANYTERAQGREQTYYVRERWSLQRLARARSRPPDKTRIFVCPNCGAPLDGMRGNVCAYCQKTVDTGEFDWVVRAIAVVEREARPPGLTGDAPEAGTNLPTRIDPALSARWSALVARDPATDFGAIQRRVALVFGELQGAWSAQNLAKARPFLTDPLVQTWAYWFDAYRKQGLRNVTEQPRLSNVELCRVSSDKYFDALTVRIFAASLDFTIDASGNVVGGSRSRPREYTEYWTLIRGSSRKGPASAAAVCPNCGAPLAVEMSGQCGYCRARVTTGDFDWVLSRIEQDEAYQG